MIKYLFVPLFSLFLISGIQAQQTFPTPEVKNLDNKVVSLSDYVNNGKPTIVAVWATWCQPCHVELDHMKKHLSKWEDEYGVDFLAVSVDKKHMVNRISPLMKRKGWSYNVLVDSDGKLQSTLGFSSIPQMYVIDTKGKIVRSFSGYRQGREDEVDKIVKRLASSK